jgi:hypothetical protein
MSAEHRDPTEDERAAWAKACNDVTEQMKVHTRPFIVPLSLESADEVRHVGTGSLIRAGGQTLLITCRHVAAEGDLNYSLAGTEDVFRGPKLTTSPSIDAAAGYLPSSHWTASSHSAQLVHWERIAETHDASVQEELFFFHGFAGENSHYGFGTLVTSASGYVTQQATDAAPDDRIFELLWEPEKTTLITSTSEHARKTMRFSNAGGLSGALVWNTRYMDTTHRKQAWSPREAVVCGLLIRWDTGTKTLLVTRIEHVRAWLKSTFGL